MYRIPPEGLVTRRAANGMPALLGSLLAGAVAVAGALTASWMSTGLG